MNTQQKKAIGHPTYLGCETAHPRFQRRRRRRGPTEILTVNAGHE